MASSTIDTLLAARQARRVGQAGSPAVARAHLRLNRMLWSEYRTYVELSPALSRQPIRIRATDAAIRRMARRLVSSSVLIPANGHYRFRSGIARSYLTGGWLEELVYCAAIEAGAEEAYYAQTIVWGAGEAELTSEIDVVARRGEALSLISCKTASPAYHDDRSAAGRTEEPVLGALYWHRHFAHGDARAIVLTTAERLAVARGHPQSQTLLARAAVIDVDAASPDFFTWVRLVAEIRDHW